MGETEPRVLIWAPAAIDDVRAVLRKNSDIRAAVIAVDSGTVVIPSIQVSMNVTANWAYLLKRKLGAGAAVFLWDEQAAVIYPVTSGISLGWVWGGLTSARQLISRVGRHGPIGRAAMALLQSLGTSMDNPAKQAKAAKRIAVALRASESVVLQNVQQREFGGPGAVCRLLEDTGKQEVAQIVRLVDAGAFDGWRDPSPWLARFRMLLGVGFLILLLLVLGMVFGLLPPDLRWHMVMGWGLAVLALALVHRRKMPRRPIDVALPVVPVVNGVVLAQPASDNQSAK